MHRAQEFDEPGVLLAFEELAPDSAANAEREQSRVEQVLKGSGGVG